MLSWCLLGFIIPFLADSKPLKLLHIFSSLTPFQHQSHVCAGPHSLGGKLLQRLQGGGSQGWMRKLIVGVTSASPCLSVAAVPESGKLQPATTSLVQPEVAMQYHLGDGRGTVAVPCADRQQGGRAGPCLGVQRCPPSSQEQGASSSEHGRDRSPLPEQVWLTRHGLSGERAGRDAHLQARTPAALSGQGRQRWL